MNPDIKTKWLAALRSGEYKQAKHVLALVNDDGTAIEGFCCLGVLCDLRFKEENIKWTMRDPYTNETRHGALTPDGTTGTLDHDTAWPWSGLYTVNPSVVVNDATYQISQLNDELGMSFEEIADVIEQQL